MNDDSSKRSESFIRPRTRLTIELFSKGCVYLVLVSIVRQIDLEHLCRMLVIFSCSLVAVDEDISVVDDCLRRNRKWNIVISCRIVLSCELPKLCTRNIHIGLCRSLITPIRKVDFVNEKSLPSLCRNTEEEQFLIREVEVIITTALRRYVVVLNRDSYLRGIVCQRSKRSALELELGIVDGSLEDINCRAIHQVEGICDISINGKNGSSVISVGITLGDATDINKGVQTFETSRVRSIRTRTAAEASDICVSQSE